MELLSGIVKKIGWRQQIAPAEVAAKNDSSEFLREIAASLAEDKALDEEQTQELVARIRSGELTAEQVDEAEKFLREFNSTLARAIAKRRLLDEITDIATLKEQIQSIEGQLRDLRAAKQKAENLLLVVSSAISNLSSMHARRPDLLWPDFNARYVVEFIAESPAGDDPAPTTSERHAA